MIAVAVLSIACLGVMGVLTYGVMAGSSAGDVTTATQYSREIIEHIRIGGVDVFDAGGPEAGLLSVDDSERTALDAAPLDADQYGALELPADSRFTRNIQILSWPDGGTTVDDETDMVRVRVRLYWGGNGQNAVDGERMTETIALLRQS